MRTVALMVFLIIAVMAAIVAADPVSSTPGSDPVRQMSSMDAYQAYYLDDW